MKWELICAAGVGGAVALTYHVLTIKVPHGISETWKVIAIDTAVSFIQLIATPLYRLNPELGARVHRSIDKVFLKDTMVPEHGLMIENILLGSVPVRVYRPRNPVGSLPGFVYYHGGGWVLNNIKSVDPICRYIAKNLQAVVVSVGYRRAPEFRFPVPLEDCVNATKAFLLQAEEFGVEAGRIAVGGENSGGNLAAAVCLRLRDESFKIKVKLQVLIYPALQCVDNLLPSAQQNRDAPCLKQHYLGIFWSLYLYGNTRLSAAFIQNKHIPRKDLRQIRQEMLNCSSLPEEFISHGEYSIQDGEEENPPAWETIKKDVTNPFVSPIFARNLNNLPAAYVVTCQYDVLRDEGFLYAHRMKSFGTQVNHVNYESGFHGLYNLFEIFDEGKSILDDMVNYLRSEL